MSFENLINGSKLPVLFIGSGLSRRYIDLPDRESLLESVYNFLDNKDFHYKHFKAKVKNTLSIKNMSAGEINAFIASRLKEKFNKHYFESNLVNEYPEWLNENVSPFKMCISSQLENYIVSEEKIDEIELFKKLRGKLHSIITTNYDTFIEDLFEFRKESIFIGQHQLFNSTSVEIDELYKLHGCVSMPERILITKEDYDDLEQISSDEYEKLAIAVGKAKTIGELGYGIKPKVEVFEDVLFNNKYLDPKRLLMGTYENHYLKIRTNIPIYKYISKVNHSVVKNLPRVKSYIKEKKTVNNYLNSSLIRSLARVPVGNKINEMPDEFKKARNRKYNWIFKNIDRLALDDIQEFLRHELSAYDKFDSNEKSNFHRLISIYDMLKYKK